MRRLLAVCTGTDFLDRRDTALIRILFDTGMRRSELAYLRVQDIDLDSFPPSVTVVGKGRHIRTVAIAKKAAATLDRYLRVRAKHKQAKAEALWVGRIGPLVDGAIDLMLRRRAKAAGITVHAHQFRHLYAHTALSHPDTKEGDVMQQAGWRSRAMLARYGASAAAERARLAQRPSRPGRQAVVVRLARLKPDGRVLCWRPLCREVLGRVVLLHSIEPCQGHPILRIEPGWSADVTGVLHLRAASLSCGAMGFGQARRPGTWLHPQTRQVLGWITPRYLCLSNLPHGIRCPRCGEVSGTAAINTLVTPCICGVST